MSNILNHNRDIFKFDLNKEDYWDFHLCVDNSPTDLSEGLVEKCLSSFIDFSDDECLWFDNAYSKYNYVWDGAVNNGLDFNSFGYVSVDNGKTYYEKDRITNSEFFKLYTETTLHIDADDLRFTMTKVRGNHQLYDYSNEITLWNDTIQTARLNGGWYQGFFCADGGSEYKTLPTDVGSGWGIEFVVNKEDFVNPSKTLNDAHPENKGIFFYIGTRAENKWWERYLTDHDFDWCSRNVLSDEYVDPSYYYKYDINNDYFGKFIEIYEDEGYFGEDYLVQQENTAESPFEKKYMNEKPCDVCSNYVDEEYYEKDLKIEEDMKLTTEGGHDMYQPNIVEYETDNKFLIFDRTCEGQKADKWDEDTKFVLDYIRKPDIGNYFTLLNRTCEGYDVDKLKKLIEIKNKEYNVLKDLYRNALAFQIRDDGTIGYKYLVKDCESEEEKYKILEEFTDNPVILNKIWYTVNIQILPVRHHDFSLNKCIVSSPFDDKMMIMIYVNGKLVLVSREIPMLNLKKLDDLDDKQQGVPFNISVGGGTQGLAEVVYLNYMKPPQYTLPLEREFGGSFIGWIKSFKFYSCHLNYQEIVKNHIFNETTLRF